MGWSEKYKKSINCDNPKGFSQRAHCQGRKKKMQEAKEQDHEVSMAQTQLKKSEENIRKLRKALGKRERDIPAWVQAKITDTEHNTDAAASYMGEEKKRCGEGKYWCKTDEKCKKIPSGHHVMPNGNLMKDNEHEEGGDVSEGKRDGKSAKDKDYSLRDWFKGGGWVQAGGKYDGKPCAKQPGQKTKPFCRDADDRAAMSKEERNKRAAKKRKEDPNPNRKGKAKFVSASYEPHNDMVEEKDACYKKVKARYDVWPSAYASGALVKCRKVGAANWGNKTKKEGYEFSNWRDDFKALEIETIDLIKSNTIKITEEKNDPCWVGYKQVGMKKKGGKMVPNCVKEEYSNWRQELDEDWQKVNKGDKTDGMSQKAVDAYRRENPGSKLKTAVTEKDPGPGRSKRRKSFCARSKGQQDMHNIDCSKTPDKAICKARRRWRC